jgi:hypothetical protein
MPTEIKCNGIYLPKLADPIIPRVEWKNYDTAINEARVQFIKDHPNKEWGSAGEFYAGMRFKSNDDVLIRIVSACPTRDHFEGNKSQWIKAGLAECASADHWYQYEKDWGVPTREEVESEDEGGDHVDDE